MSAQAYADYLQRARYGDLDDAELAAALRGWAAWRDEQRAVLPDFARAYADLAGYVEWYDDGVDIIFNAMTSWLRREAERRLHRPAHPHARLTTTELLARYGDRLTRAGPDRWRCRCPFHEDRRPSMIVCNDGHYHCFACRAHGLLSDLAAAWGRESAA